MIAGINRRVEHDGKRYHVQAEDLGREAAVFDLRLYHQGALLWSKRIAYGDLIAGTDSPETLEAALLPRIEQALVILEAAVARGKIPGASPDPS